MCYRVAKSKMYVIKNDDGERTSQSWMNQQINLDLEPICTQQLLMKKL
jgi:hypothetical protein